MTRALVTQMLEAMEQGYMMTGAHAKYTAAITAAREYLATEPSGELAQSAEPVAWVNFARKKPTAKSLSFSRELTIFEKANGFVSNPLYLHPPQPHAEPEQSGERAELANEIRSTANHLSRYDTPGFPMNPFAAVCHKAADMLEADAREAKRVPMSDGVIAVITDACFQAVADQGTTVLMRAVARAIEAHHGITQGEKPQATTPVPEGYVLVPAETLLSIKGRVNTLATLSMKADRYSVGIAIKQTIADILAAAQGEKP